MVTLLLASKADNASVNLHEAVVGLGGWDAPEILPHGLFLRHSTQPVHLLLIEKLHIYADGIDIIHEKETAETGLHLLSPQSLFRESYQYHPHKCVTFRLIVDELVE